jgi:hypothetical protein
MVDRLPTIYQLGKHCSLLDVDGILWLVDALLNFLAATGFQYSNTIYNTCS